MNKTKIISKALLGATALTVFSAGTAHAQLTPAGTNVQNTFTLDYRVSGVDQPQIDTTATPTEFTVDRLIDLTVTSNGDTTVAPGAVDQELVFSLTNDGNDTQAFSLAIVEETTDDFDTNDPVSATPVIVYYIDDGDGLYEPGVGAGLDGAPITYDPLNPPVLDPDDQIWVVVTQDVDSGEVDATQADISLVADTLDSTSPFAPVVGDGDGNSLTGAAENVLADGSSTGNEVANAGDDSATGSYVVAAADVAASKAVTVHTEDGTNCTTIPGVPVAGGYSVPGACVEYVITVDNTGSQDATDIIINDVLANELRFAAATFGGDFTGGSFNSPGACVVNLTGVTLPAPVTPAVITTGTVTIRAYVK